MKTHLNPRHPAQQGGALIVTLLIALILGVAMASYLMLVSNQNNSVMRSLSWNTAIPALEAGLEEALTQINTGGATNRTSNGWELQADGWYQKCRGMADGVAFIARINWSDTNRPVIVSTGIVPSPLSQMSAGNTCSSIYTAAADRSNFIMRTVHLVAERNALFAKGIVAEGDIDLRGNDVETDSFDSRETGGLYDPSLRRDQGDVATNSSLTNSLDVGNANVIGTVSTGPGGVVDIGNGSVGDVAWVTGHRSGIQEGRSTDDMNVKFYAVTPPYTTGSTPSSGTEDGTNYQYILDSAGASYYVNSVTGKILVEGKCTLYVSSTLNIAGQDYIYIAPGASLTMYVAAPSASIGGTGVVNATGNALSFQYYGLPANTDLSFAGNAAFVGTIYAPNADFHMGGGGSTRYDFVGASITRTVQMNGHFNFHYDEALRDLGPTRAYVPSSWNEMQPGFGLALSAYSVGGGTGGGGGEGSTEPVTQPDVVYR